jgi:hypothetical protein
MVLDIAQYKFDMLRNLYKIIFYRVFIHYYFCFSVFNAVIL